jgi:hypothetical protein
LEKNSGDGIAKKTKNAAAAAQAGAAAADQNEDVSGGNEGESRSKYANGNPFASLEKISDDGKAKETMKAAAAAVASGAATVQMQSFVGNTVPIVRGEQQHKTAEGEQEVEQEDEDMVDVTRVEGIDGLVLWNRGFGSPWSIGQSSGSSG